MIPRRGEVRGLGDRRAVLILSSAIYGRLPIADAEFGVALGSDEWAAVESPRRSWSS